MHPAVLAVTAFGLTGSAAAGSEALEQIDAPGVWSVNRLGGAAVTVVRAPEREESTSAVIATYRLPRHVRQGGQTWYLIKLHFRLTVRPDSGPGTIYVSASTGSPSDLRASAQIIFKVRRTASGLAVMSDSLGLVSGHEVETSRSRHREVRFTNYIPYGGIVEGRNALVVQLEQYDAARVKELRVFGDSGIELSSRGPQQLRLVARAMPREVEVGDRIEVRATVRNIGGRSSGQGVVRITHAPPALRLKGSRTKKFEPVPGGGSIERRFSLEATRPGTWQVIVEAQAGLDHPASDLLISVSRTSGQNPVPKAAALAIVVAVGAIALGAAVVARGHRRRQKPEDV